MILCLASAQVLATEYTYVSYGAPAFYDLGRESFTLNTSTKEMISSDAIEEVFICDAASKYHCFQNLAVSFYVPKEGLSVGQAWHGNDLAFRALREQRLEIFGVVKSVWVIEVERADRTDAFYYSERDGLMAIKHLSKKGLPAQFFLVTGMKGFPK